jgi:hypothetical protein
MQSKDSATKTPASKPTAGDESFGGGSSHSGGLLALLEPRSVIGTARGKVMSGYHSHGDDQSIIRAAILKPYVYVPLLRWIPGWVS